MKKLRTPTDAEEAAIQRGIAADPDNPEWTDADFERARPAVEVLGHAAVVALVRRRGPQRSDPKIPVSLRLDTDIVAALRATGPGWQKRANDALRKAVLG
jgi:uncharacterized protein (DUF4415 family)